MTKKELRSMGDKIKAKRIQLGYTQEQAAELTELSFSTYSKIENAVQGPSLDALIRISTVLDISMDYMIFGNKNILYIACNHIVAIKNKNLIFLLLSF